MAPPPAATSQTTLSLITAVSLGLGFTDHFPTELRKPPPTQVRGGHIKYESTGDSLQVMLQFSKGKKWCSVVAVLVI